MRADGSLDLPAFERLVDWQIREGIQGLVPCGTTGESPTLTFDETAQLVRTAVQVADRRVPILAGAGANNTREAIELSHIAQEAGADALLHVVPYYNKPSQRGIYAHMKAIHDETDLPIILYNVPGRTVVSMSIETQAALAELPRIAGVKDATGDLARVGQTRAATGDHFIQLTGEDDNTLEFLQQGGHGAISVTSNIAPRLCSQLFNAYNEGDYERAATIHAALKPVHRAMFLKLGDEDESSPSQVKYAGARMGLWDEHMRLPLTPVQGNVRRAIDAAIAPLISANRARPAGARMPSVARVGMP